MNTLDMSDTIKPKSDQLNADDLITGPMTVQIAGVRKLAGDQPIAIEIAGYQPFKPCKTMRRLMILAWGNDGNQWVGRSMTLFRDETVRWAGKAIGGIRISHMSHIQPFDVTLNASAKHKLKHSIQVLVPEDFTPIINQYLQTPQDQQQALWESLTARQQQAIQQAMELQQ